FVSRSVPTPQLHISRFCLYPTRDLSGEPADGTLAPCAGVILSGGFLYIYSGHSRASAAIRAGAPFIQCSLLAAGGDMLDSGPTVDEYAGDNFTLPLARAWADIHGFGYYSYPL
ncbi:MAG: hypothetical protein LBC21_05190, partial [Oscillospiraceae bacterium]|nr:hypothetical protein [Oscillospiraceae bacterium]